MVRQRLESPINVRKQAQSFPRKFRIRRWPLHNGYILDQSHWRSKHKNENLSSLTGKNSYSTRTQRNSFQCPGRFVVSRADGCRERRVVIGGTTSSLGKIPVRFSTSHHRPFRCFFITLLRPRCKADRIVFACLPLSRATSAGSSPIAMRKSI